MTCMELWLLSIATTTYFLWQTHVDSTKSFHTRPPGLWRVLATLLQVQFLEWFPQCPGSPWHAAHQACLPGWRGWWWGHGRWRRCWWGAAPPTLSPGHGTWENKYETGLVWQHRDCKVVMVCYGNDTGRGWIFFGVRYKLHLISNQVFLMVCGPQ